MQENVFKATIAVQDTFIVKTRHTAMKPSTVGSLHATRTMEPDWVIYWSLGNFLICPNLPHT